MKNDGIVKGWLPEEPKDEFIMLASELLHHKLNEIWEKIE